MSKHKPSNQLTWGELQQRIRKETLELIQFCSCCT